MTTQAAPEAESTPNVSRPRPWQRSALLAVVVLCAAAAALLVYTRVRNPHNFYGTAYPAGLRAPTLQGTGENGRPLALDDLRGQTVAVFFGFLACPNICPTTLASLENIRKKLPAAQQDKFTPLLVSVDPKRDTPAKIKAYVNYFNPRARGLRIPEPTLTQAASEWGVAYQYTEVMGPLKYQVNHTTGVYLVDAEGRLRLVWDYTQLTQQERVIRDIREVMR